MAATVGIPDTAVLARAARLLPASAAPFTGARRMARRLRRPSARLFLRIWMAFSLRLRRPSSWVTVRLNSLRRAMLLSPLVLSSVEKEANPEAMAVGWLERVVARRGCVGVSIRRGENGRGRGEGSVWCDGVAGTARNQREANDYRQLSSVIFCRRRQKFRPW